MFKHNTFRRLALWIAWLVLITFGVNTTFGFIATKTWSIVNTFKPFENTADSVQPTNVSVYGTAYLDGRPWQSGDTFSFRLEQQLGDNIWVSLGTRTVTYDADDPAFHRFDFTDELQKLTFDTIGTYRFRITELAGDAQNVTYDTTVGAFTIEVTDVNGAPTIGSVFAAQHTTVTEENGHYTVAVAFYNTFTSIPNTLNVPITVHKTVNNVGSAAIGPNGFEFVLHNTQTNEHLSLRSDENGTAVFLLPFTVADVGKTYTYTLTETNEGEADITYDNTVHIVSVHITTDSQQRPTATVFINGVSAPSPVVHFVNTAYIPSSPPTGKSGLPLHGFGLLVVSGILCIFVLHLKRKATAYTIHQ